MPQCKLLEGRCILLERKRAVAGPRMARFAGVGGLAGIFLARNAIIHRLRVQLCSTLRQGLHHAGIS